MGYLMIYWNTLRLYRPLNFGCISYLKNSLTASETLLHHRLYRMTFYNVSCNLAPFKLSSAAQWVQNGITVAGLADGTNGSSLNSLSENFGVYCADDGILYIADGGNDRIVLIAPNSTTAVAVAGRTWDSNSFSFPADVFVTRTSIYVMDTWNFRVQKWSKSLFDPITVAGIPGVRGNSTDMMKLSNAYNLFVDNYDNVFVSDYSNNRVMMFPWSSTSGTNGVMVAGTGMAGSASNQLDGPSGVFVTDDRSLYIADCDNHRIQKWTIGATSGVTVAGGNGAGKTLSQLDSPYTVFVDLNGYMYITDYKNNRIMRWAPNTSAGECIVACSDSPGISSNQLNGPSSMTFDSSGSMYINDFGKNRVQKFKLLSETSMISVRSLFSI